MMIHIERSLRSTVRAAAVASFRSCPGVAGLRAADGGCILVHTEAAAAHSLAHTLGPRIWHRNTAQLERTAVVPVAGGQRAVAEPPPQSSPVGAAVAVAAAAMSMWWDPRWSLLTSSVGYSGCGAHVISALILRDVHLDVHVLTVDAQVVGLHLADHAGDLGVFECYKPEAARSPGKPVHHYDAVHDATKFFEVGAEVRFVHCCLYLGGSSKRQYREGGEPSSKRELEPNHT